MTGFGSFFANHLMAAQSTTAAKESKNASRATAETSIRSLVKPIQANPAVSDAQRVGLGITIPDVTRTTSMSSGLAGRSVVTVDTSQRLRHEISFRDESTPTSRAKPSRVMGCKIWNAVTAAGEAAPVDVSSYSFVALDTALPYVTEYEGT